MLDSIKSLAVDYLRDGVVHLPGVLDQRTQQLVAQFYDWSMAHPTPSGCMMYPDTNGAFYQDLCNPAAALAYRELLVDTVIRDIAASLWGPRGVVSLRTGMAQRRRRRSPYTLASGLPLPGG